uniref:Invertebrate defensins family profile domain-containing protein n=1 Tax=Anopheles culicifacies TaxID=139723 RepID=A0A3F2YVC5_9DIPT
MRALTQLVALFAVTLVLLLVFTEMASSNPISLTIPMRMQQPSYEVPFAGDAQSRSAMVQTLTCTNPTCSAQCRGRGYRRGSCTIGRCFCSYV